MEVKNSRLTGIFYGLIMTPVSAIVAFFSSMIESDDPIITKYLVLIGPVIFIISSVDLMFFKGEDCAINTPIIYGIIVLIVIPFLLYAI